MKITRNDEGQTKSESEIKLEAITNNVIESYLKICDDFISAFTFHIIQDYPDQLKRITIEKITYYLGEAIKDKIDQIEAEKKGREEESQSFREDRGGDCFFPSAPRSKPRSCEISFLGGLMKIRAGR